MTARRLRHSQSGVALLIFLVLLVMAALTHLVNQLTSETADLQRARQTAVALARARDALLGYALRYRDLQVAKDADSNGDDDRVMYGYLPLPDLGSSRNNNLDPNCLGAGVPLEGCDANTFTGGSFDSNGIGPTVVGRLPWRTLGIEPLRDGDGECLWLIVSSLHSRIQRSSPAPLLPPMNWDTPGQLDIVVANGSQALGSALASAHDRPVAIIFSPGPPLPGQNRSPSTSDDVRQCGGNYHAANYLDPANASALGGVANYLAGTNAASGTTGDSDPGNDPDTPKPLSIAGKVFATGGGWVAGSCPGNDCRLVANDRGMGITPDSLFGAVRQNGNFRADLNTLLDRIAGCLRDELAAGGSLVKGKIAGADNHACYGASLPPLGYYPHWREMIFVAAPATVNGIPCAGGLLFAGQRTSGQSRLTPAEKVNPANYLEGGNLSSFLAGTHSFNGPDLLDRVSTGGQAAGEDVVRCIPAGASLNQVVSPALNALGGQLTHYDPASRSLTLGRRFALTTAQRNANAQAFFGCSWTPETHLLGNGLRSYFRFRIGDTGEGFSFAIADGDRNTAFACGAARQHLGYSGSNGITASIAPPKIGIEIDTSKQSGLPPAATYGRNDPSYTGGHVGIVYWGSDADVTDDNIHGWPATPALSRPAPPNPPAPASPTAGAGVYKLDPSLSQVPVNQDIHLRVELSRTATDEASHSSRWLLEVWLLKESLTDANLIAAMKNTTRPMALLASGFAAHLRDTPTIYDLQGDSCAGGLTCPGGQSCSSSDNICIAPALRTVRLGFTTSQSTAANDQLINISDFVTTWLP